MGKREAAGQVRHSHTQKPLSITVIALYLLFGACVMPINVFAHAPAFLLSIDLEGIKAAIFFLTMGGLDAVIGIALLRTARWSRTLAI